jgi:hypothetical protein
MYQTHRQTLGVDEEKKEQKKEQQLLLLLLHVLLHCLLSSNQLVSQWLFLWCDKLEV